MIPLILGALLSGFGEKKAAKTQSRNIDRGVAQARPLFEQAAGRLDPFASSGAAAQGFLNQALGLGGAAGGAGGGGFDPTAYFSANPDVASFYNQNVGNPEFLRDIEAAGYPPTAEGFAQLHRDRHGVAEGRDMGASQGGAAGGAGAGGVGEALQRFRESLGFRDTQNAALRGVGANAAARGLLGSSGTGNTFQRSAANLANQTYGGFLDRLTGVAGRGQQAASGQAGIDTGLGGALLNAQTAKGSGGKGSLLSNVGNSVTRALFG